MKHTVHLVRVQVGHCVRVGRRKVLQHPRAHRVVCQPLLPQVFLRVAVADLARLVSRRPELIRHHRPGRPEGVRWKACRVVLTFTMIASERICTHLITSVFPDSSPQSLPASHDDKDTRLCCFLVLKGSLIVHGKYHQLAVLTTHRDRLHCMEPSGHEVAVLAEHGAVCIGLEGNATVNGPQEAAEFTDCRCMLHAVHTACMTHGALVVPRD